MKHTDNTTSCQVAVYCITCGAEDYVIVPAGAWLDWTDEQQPSCRALNELDPLVVRWLTQSICPECYADVLSSSGDRCLVEVLCRRCGRWESFWVSVPAVAAFRRGELTER